MKAPTDPSKLKPGQVWWCDGAALAFEAHFKRRPVLIGAIEEDDVLVVLPLSSHRRYGQETTVTHAGGVSYLTGTYCKVTVADLHKPLGSWDGFAAWEAEQRAAAEATANYRQFWRKGFWQRLRRLLKGH